VSLDGQAGALGMLLLALATLLGVGAGAVGLFVLRVEFVQLVQRVRDLETELRDGRQSGATD